MVKLKRNRVMPYFRILFAVMALFAGGVAAAGEEMEEEEAPPTAADIPTRIAQAEVGEWCLYRYGGDGGGRLRMTVTDKWQEGKDVRLIILHEHVMKGRKTKRTEEKISVQEAVDALRNLTEEDRIARGETLVLSRRLEVVIVDYVERGKSMRRSYFSDKIPVHGLARGVDTSGSKDKNILTLIDYGFADDEVE